MYGIYTYIEPPKPPQCRHIFHTWSVWVYIYIYICMFSSGNMDAFLGTWTEDPLLQGAKLLTHSLLSE